MFVVSVPGAFAQSGVNAPVLDPFEITLRTEGPNPKQPAVNQTVEWSIVVRWQAAERAVNPTIQKSPSFDGIDIETQSTTIRTGREDDRNYSEKVFTYHLIAKQEGEARIGTATIVYTTGDDNSESYLTTLPVSFTVEPEPFSWVKFFKNLMGNSYFRIFVLLLIIVTIICVTFVRINRLKKAALKDVEEPKQSPSQEALDTARRFRMEGLSSEYMSALEKAVRLELQERFPDVETSDLIHYREKMDEKAHPVLERFSKSCEEVKYSPVAPTPDTLDRIWDDANRLIGDK